MLITLLAAMNCVICVYYAGDLLMLLNVSSTEGVLLTTYGKLQPPLGKHRLKVVHICMIFFSKING